MKKQIIKDSEMFNFFRDYYKFIQDYAIPEQSDTFWDELIKASDELCNKYGNEKYYRDMVMAHLDALERKKL